MALPAISQARWANSDAATVGSMLHSAGDPGWFTPQCGQEAHVGGAQALPNIDWANAHQQHVFFQGQANKPERSNASTEHIVRQLGRFSPGHGIISGAAKQFVLLE